jgi:hypothetical protein
MESHTHNIKKADTNVFIKDVRHTYNTFSDPEDDVSSGVESFDEDDMYGSGNGDDIICDDPDMGSPDMGSPDIGSPDMESPDMGSPDIGSPDMDSPDMDSLDMDSLDMNIKIQSLLGETVS